MTQDVGLASAVCTVAAWLLIGGALLVALLLLFGRGKVDDAAVDYNANDTEPLPDLDAAA